MILYTFNGIILQYPHVCMSLSFGGGGGGGGGGGLRNLAL